MGQGILDWGVSARTAPGASEMPEGVSTAASGASTAASGVSAAASGVSAAASGDAHLVVDHPDGALVAVIDGLGHGEKAAVVAQKTVATLQEAARAGDRLPDVAALMERCHRALVGTRGVVMSLAVFEATAEAMTWLGVGNVEGLLLRADPAADPARVGLLVRGGILGYHLPNLRPATVHVAPGDTLVFATDGLRSSFVGDLEVGVAPQALADRVLAAHERGTDDALVLVARYVGNLRSLRSGLAAVAGGA